MAQVTFTQLIETFDFLLAVGQTPVLCYTSTGCAGTSFTATSPRVCCVGAGYSYNDGVSCFECIGE